MASPSPVAVETEASDSLRKEIASMRTDMQRLELIVQKTNGVPAKPSTLQAWLKARWEELRKKFGDTDLVLTGTAGLHMVVYWGFGLTMLALQNRLERWKLQPGKSPTKAMMKRLFMVVLRNNGILLILTAIARKLKPVQEHCKAMAEVPIPTVRRAFTEVLFHFVVNDVVFYFIHSLLHTPYFYKRIHKIHHEFKAPIALAAEHAHPLEYIFSNIVPGALGPHLLNSHPIVSWLWLCIGIAMTSFHHGGYVIPFYPLNEWALLHDYHHASFYSNMGVTGLLDKTLGTDGGSDYTDWRKTVIKRVKIANSFLFWKHPVSEWLQVW